MPLQLTASFMMLINSLIMCHNEQVSRFEEYKLGKKSKFFVISLK